MNIKAWGAQGLLLSVMGGCGHPPGIGAGPAQAADAPSALGATPEAPPASSAAPSPAVVQAVEASDRAVEDRILDEGRKPIEMLSFFGIAPGQRVAELAAGGGYTAELLARVVGPEGRVYGQNTPFILDRFAQQPWTERLGKPVMSNVVRVDSELEDPLPPEARGLDAVLLVLFYHDTVWFETDRHKLNQAVYRALRPGGIYGIVDHAAQEGAGVSVAKSLHRIEESVVVDEVRAAGFVLEADGDFLRNPGDERDWNASPTQAGARRGTSDRFVLLFRKPEAAVSSDVPPSEAPVVVAEPAGFTRCEGPRSPACTKEYRPVCASVDNGVRCVTAPCPSTAQKTYPNACTACADEKVSGYVAGACPAGGP